ncbi:polymer-forming cytoskeletal protein [Shewanella seohaensis]|uniref:bactofilin family protein n=1 Tax=Shewanella seohaensis TaxID=755175 RepID=UPI00200DCE1E|nr:polymer-forming cytoskeletal protein [Shewanella seohaensis]MCL1119527.1 polymer-forming cytoskeletal protein [Shewanella seohaensis]UXM83644.1 polymer-forming cytoskeletal protein [Shewanella seohaensis]
MFGKKFTFTRSTSPALSFIAEGTKLTGNIEFAGDVLIGGDVQGQILSQANVIVERTGNLHCEVKCRELIIDGYFKGRLICERLVIQAHGIVDGDVACTSMQISEGGQFIGLRIKEDHQTIHAHSLPSASSSSTLITPVPTLSPEQE